MPLIGYFRRTTLKCTLFLLFISAGKLIGVNSRRAHSFGLRGCVFWRVCQRTTTASVYFSRSKFITHNHLLFNLFIEINWNKYDP